jgi:RNA polymerase sigma-70 factor (ECF subfamily)
MSGPGRGDGDAPAARADRQAAFAGFVRRHFALVQAAARVRLPASLADDAVAETFFRAWRDNHRLDALRRPGNWLYGVAVRVCMEMLRAERRTVTTDPATLGAVAAAPPDDSEAHRVRDAVAALETPLREVIHLKYVAAMSYRQMAETLGVSVATIGARLTRARQWLRERLSRLDR